MRKSLAMVTLLSIVAVLAVGLLAGCGGKGGGKASGTALEGKTSVPDKHNQVKKLDLSGGAAARK